MLRRFHGKMKRRYEKAGLEYRWICVTEHRTTNIHHHLIIPNHPDLLTVLKECWKEGHLNLTPIYHDMDVERLAEYLLKETKNTKQKTRYGLKQPPCLFSVKEHQTGEKRDRDYPSKRMAKRAKAYKRVLHRQRFRI